MFRKAALASAIFLVAAASALPAAARDDSRYYLIRGSQGCFVSSGTGGGKMLGKYNSMSSAQWALQRKCR